MNKAIVSLAVAMTLFALMGCNNRGEVESVSPVRAEKLKPMQQSWRGILPCADCEGIETSLFLEKDGTWVMNQDYQGGKAPSNFASYGRWARTADKLVLTDASGEKLYFRAKGSALEMLDREGNPIRSQLNYVLQPVTATLPTTPMAMRGMYSRTAGVAEFADCMTGKRIAVSSDVRPEQQYKAAAGQASQPVLLEVEGHFALQPKTDNGAMEKTLVADKNAKFIAGKDCNHQ